MALRRVQVWAWLTLFYNVFVILWGAFVRATGSGAGCGDHWPLCNGVIVPRAPEIETIIEFTHRITSGLALVMVVVLFVLARKATPAGHSLRNAAKWSVIFIIFEALIGAGLVLFELVAHNASLKRMFSMSAHLLNTFALISAFCLVIWRSSDPSTERHAPLNSIWKHRWLVAGGILLGLTGMSGAIAALGDTLFKDLGALPLKSYFGDETPLLVRLRLIHPVVALIATAVVLINQAKCWRFYEDRLFALVGWSVSALVLSQVLLGFINVQLMAPVWMQLVHLGVGVGLWVAYSFGSFLIIDKTLKVQGDL